MPISFAHECGRQIILFLNVAAENSFVHERQMFAWEPLIQISVYKEEWVISYDSTVIF